MTDTESLRNSKVVTIYCPTCGRELKLRPVQRADKPGRLEARCGNCGRAVLEIDADSADGALETAPGARKGKKASDE